MPASEAYSAGGSGIWNCGLRPAANCEGSNTMTFGCCGKAGYGFQPAPADMSGVSAVDPSAFLAQQRDQQEAGRHAGRHTDRHADYDGHGVSAHALPDDDGQSHTKTEQNQWYETFHVRSPILFPLRRSAGAQTLALRAGRAARVLSAPRSSAATTRTHLGHQTRQRRGCPHRRPETESPGPSPRARSRPAPIAVRHCEPAIPDATFASSALTTLPTSRTGKFAFTIPPDQGGGGTLGRSDHVQPCLTAPLRQTLQGRLPRSCRRSAAGRPAHRSRPRCAAGSG